MTFPTGEHPVLDHLNAVRLAMLERDALLLNELVKQYARSYRMLAGDIKALQAAIKGIQPTKAQLIQLAAMRNLLDGVKGEMDNFAGILANKLQAATLLEMQMADADTLALVQKSLPGMDPARLIGTWTRLAPKQVYTMFAFTDPNGPLFANIRTKFGLAIANFTRDALVEGYIMGMNPREIARLMARAQGIGLDWALNMARTACLWSYRTASHINYLNNSHVVQAWVWIAQLDDRVCLSCIHQHGSVHPLTEVLADHHLGRCTPAPKTVSYAELGIDGIKENPFTVQGGEEWFKALAEAQQMRIMGGAKFRAWKDGAFEFNQLTKVYNDTVYGRMLREASLKEILGDKAKLYYA